MLASASSTEFESHSDLQRNPPRIILRGYRSSVTVTLNVEGEFSEMKRIAARGGHNH